MKMGFLFLASLFLLLFFFCERNTKKIPSSIKCRIAKSKNKNINWKISQLNIMPKNKQINGRKNQKPVKTFKDLLTWIRDKNKYKYILRKTFHSFSINYKKKYIPLEASFKYKHISIINQKKNQRDSKRIKSHIKISFFSGYNLKIRRWYHVGSGLREKTSRIPRQVCKEKQEERYNHHV